MTTAPPRVSVVIPTFNQARFLPAAVESALAQSYGDREIIIVDDGSTDDTPAVARRYDGAVRCVRQANKGLAGARNAGIACARGEFVALLDSDDVWQPVFLEHMVSLADRQPAGTVYFCAWRYMDDGGTLLPEPAHVHVGPPAGMYRSILRANCIVPSTVIMRRAAVVSAGLFDEDFRRLQDWELWVRLLREGHTLVGSADCDVQYRLHGQALSEDREGGQRAALALARKHFGEDDGRVEQWPPDKRWCYAGVYRYQALLSARRREEWARGGRCLRKAIAIDPTLAADRGLFHELAWSGQPAGHRRVAGAAVVEECSRTLFGLLHAAWGRERGAASRRCYGQAHLTLGAIAYGCGQLACARRHLASGIRIWPPVIVDARFGALLVRACLGVKTMATLKHLKERTRGVPC